MWTSIAFAEKLGARANPEYVRIIPSASILLKANSKLPSFVRRSPRDDKKQACSCTRVLRVGAMEWGRAMKMFAINKQGHAQLQRDVSEIMCAATQFIPRSLLPVFPVYEHESESATMPTLQR